jgi:enoyl-[acyl-carrier protein] reductase / trans-2-enoyl-CoA reductase (NAD+)
MAGVILQNPIARFPLVLAGHAGGSIALAEQQFQRAQQAFPQFLDHATGRTALVIGNTSFGYGSAAAMALRAAGFESIIGIGFENPPVVKDGKVNRASPGWYLTYALHKEGAVNRTYFADAFADATRERVIGDLVGANRKIDLLLYSLAALARSYNGQKWTSALKVIGEPVNLMALDYKTGTLKPKTVEAANEEEIENTRRVMGGEDLAMWVSGLLYADRLQEGAKVAALSYIGPPQFEALRRLYWDGTIGAAKKDIDKTVLQLNRDLLGIRGTALSVVDPAVVTQASTAIPAIAKYLAAYLGVVDGGVGIYNDPLAVGIQFAKALYGPGEPWKHMLDREGRLRLDTDEMEPVLQDAIMKVWSENDHEGEASPTLKRGLEIFKTHFLRLFGFEVPGVDYSQPYEFEIPLTTEMGVHNLLAPAPTVAPAPAPAVIESKRPSRADETMRISAVDLFFNQLLSRENEPGVSKIQEGDKTVFVSSHTFDAAAVRLYAETTNQPVDGTVPSAYTFVIGFPGVLDAIKDLLKNEEKKSVVHAAEEIELMGGGPLRAEGTVTVRTWLGAAKRLRGQLMAFVQREIVGADGKLLATGKTTLLIGADLSQLPAVAAKPEDLEGELLGALPITQDWINRYSEASGDQNPIHLSEGAAKALGLSSTIAHGVLTLGLTNRDHAPSYKAAWKTPVAPGDTLEVRRSGKKVVGIKVAPDGQKFLAIELTPR